jgi:hypothetical protein
MYFVRYAPLKEKLRDRTLTDREALPYMVVYAALISALFFPLPQDGFNAWDMGLWLMSIAAAVGGTFYVYAKNGGCQGHDFIQKVFVLGWVVAFRCLLVLIPVAVLSFVGLEFAGMLGEETGWPEVLLLIGFEVFYYQRLGRHIADTRANAAGAGLLPALPGQA